MNHDLIQKAEQYGKIHKKQRLWKRSIGIMGLILAFSTAYALVLPAITQERPLICGYEEHTHTDECLSPLPVLICTAEENHLHDPAVCYMQKEGIICGYEETEGHTHDETCYSQQEVILCGLEETAGHIHDDSCYTEQSILGCGTEESSGHSHSDSCYESVLICSAEESAGHTHSDVCRDADGVLICGIEESAGHIHGDGCYESQITCGLSEGDGAHSHSEDCYINERVLICEQTECDPHTHDDSCKGLESVLSCGQEEHEAHTHDDSCKGMLDVLLCTEPENHLHEDGCYETPAPCVLKEHEHTDSCYGESSNPNADLESSADWEYTMQDVELTGVWAEDILAIAKTQLGYEESSRNFIYDENYNKKGYTRYGEWYGVPYGDWCAMFVAFCLEYAEIPEDVFPRDAACDYWVDELIPLGLYAEADEYTPVPGDLIFYDWDDDPYAEHIGIVAEVYDTTVTAIEGNTSNMVAYRTYDLDDPCVIGYGLLPIPVTEEVTLFNTPLRSAINESGTLMYHHPDYIEYQYSSHRVNDFMTLTYVLIPYDSIDGWTPNILNWSSSANANYVVAYCADRQTDVSVAGEHYTTVKIQDSSYYSTYATVLSGIVEHAYPFITAAEMRAELLDAYENGEISIDLSCCVESEFIAAAQWAIWDATEISGTQTTASGATFPSYNVDALNPLSDVGHTASSTIQSHVKAIRDWLMTQRAPEDLAVENHISDVCKNADGTYDVITTVTLNRPLEKREEVLIDFTAGESITSLVLNEEGANEFTVSLTGLTPEEVLGAEIQLTVFFEHMQVFVYDSENYQDMISGQWGEDVYEFSFNIDVETTSVDVSKHWSNNEIGAEYIEVQLYADGEKYGSPVRLNEDNDWTYCWDKLLKYSSEGVLIDYSVTEILIPGYYSAITKDTSGSSIITTMTPATAFEEGETYLLTYDNLNALANESGSDLSWARDQNLTVPDNIPQTALWTATSVSTDGSNAYLQNVATGNYLYYDGSYITTSSSASAKTYFQYNHLYLLNGDYNRYLTYLDGGLGYITDDWDSALSVSLYKRTQTERSTADISFLITNTKTPELTSVAVTKEWSGRADETYPEQVEVILLQNGEPYGNTITLSAANEWYYCWEHLPAELNDQQFEYTVEELQIKDYAVETTVSTDENGTILFTLANTWSPEYIPLLLSKVDAANSSLPLPGAVFQLYLTTAMDTNNAVSIPGTDDLWGIPTESITTGEDGTFRIEQLWVGEIYCLVEISAPHGYAPLTDPIVFTAVKDENNQPVLTIHAGETWARAPDITDAGELTMQVRNEQVYELPETGGSGTGLYTFTGLALMGTAFGALLHRHRKKAKEDLNTS